MSTEPSAQIVSLKIKNFLSISDVEIKPGQINQVIGANNAGKTTVLKAIEFVAKGSSDATLVRNGSDGAEVILELSDETVIRRRLSSDGRQSVDIKRDGFKAPSPQSFLDALFDQSSFNPLELLTPEGRTEAILKSIEIKLTPELLAAETGMKIGELPPLDYSVHGLKVLDQGRRYFYQRRAEANRVAAEKKSRVDIYAKDLPPVEPAAPHTRKEIEDAVEARLSEVRTAEEKLKGILGTHESAKQAEARVEKYHSAVMAIEHEIIQAREKMTALEARKAEGLKFVTEAQKEVPAALEDDRPAREHIANLKAKAEETRGLLKDLDRREAVSKQFSMVDQMRKEHLEAEGFATSLDKVVAIFSEVLPNKVMLSAEMPVSGLEYREGAFYVNGSAVDNLSSSAALKLAIAVARKLSRKHKLVCIDGAEALDTDAYKALIEEVAGDGFTYFITSVGSRNHPNHKVFEMKGGTVQ